MSSGDGTDGENNDDGEQNDEQEGDGRWRTTYKICRFEADESLYDNWFLWQLANTDR